MIVYSNSCSYGKISDGKVYSEFVADYFGATFINSGIASACNERIIRTSVRDILNIIKSNDPSSVLVLIGVTNTFRGELWGSTPALHNDGHFYSFTSTTDFSKNSYLKEFYKAYDQEAASTNLCCQLVMLTSMLDYFNIRYLIWANTPHLKAIDWSANFVKPFYETIENNKNIISLFDFNFIDYIKNLGYEPLDKPYDQGGHANEMAHKEFSKFLIKKINDLHPTVSRV